jgi:hypothetical protein
MVVVGFITLEYGDLEKVTDAMPAQLRLQIFVPSTVFTLRRLYQHLQSHNRALPLSYLVFLDIHLQATVAVDKIYAFLRLSNKA